MHQSFILPRCLLAAGFSNETLGQDRNMVRDIMKSLKGSAFRKRARELIMPVGPQSAPSRRSTALQGG